MARFTKSFRSLQSARRALPPGLKALAAVVAVAVLLTVGQVTLQARMVEAQIAQAELQAEMEQARIEARIQAQDVEADRAALTALFNSTSGSGWTNANQWNTSGPLSDWHGVTTNAAGRVTGLRLGDNNLTGTIPAALGNLTDLTDLALWDNNLTGTIPASLGSLSSLRELTLYNNQLSGSIPPQLGNANSLINLTFRNNQLTGTIPTELGNLTSMISMDFNDNQLTGQLPYSLTSLTNLTSLRLHNNAGLCVPLDSDFQTWYGTITTREGDNCPRTRIHISTAAPVVGEPVIAELTAREDRLARIEATLAGYTGNPCIGYDGRRRQNAWSWRRASAPTGPFATVRDGRHPNATFVYLPQAADVGMYLIANVTVDGNAYDTDPVGPVAAAHGIPSGDQVDLDAPTGTVQVDNDLSVSLPDAAAAERHDPAINPRLFPWQWERSDDGTSDWTNVTPYHKHCEAPDSQYSLTSDDDPMTIDDDGKHLRAYIYYNDDSSGGAVLKRGETASVGPVVP